VRIPCLSALSFAHRTKARRVLLILDRPFVFACALPGSSQLETDANAGDDFEESNACPSAVGFQALVKVCWK
jgi:hypothetical protein